MMRKFLIFIQQYGEDVMKHWKIIGTAALIAGGMNFSFAEGIKPGVPKGWQLWGSESKYEIGIDPAESTPDHPALLIASKNASASDTLALTQDIDGTEWLDQQIELSLWVKAIGAKKNRVWIRHNRKGYQSLAAQSIPEGKDWERIVIKTHFTKPADPQYDNHFDIGIVLGSEGKIWVRDLKLERRPYQPDPNKIDLPAFRSGLPAYPPRNLNFTE